MEKRYMISDASRMVDVESHVLRYWEEELLIDIPRNEMGHRYYTGFHIELMKKVKDLKERGFQLKAIRMLVPELCENGEDSVDTLSVMKEELGNVEQIKAVNPDVSNQTSSKMEQFEAILGNIVSKALRENNSELGKEVSDHVSENVIKEIDYMMRLQDEREEERFRKFDEILRNYQTGRKELSSNKERKSIISFMKKGPRTN